MAHDCCAHETTACAGPPPLVLPAKTDRAEAASHGSATASCCSGGVAVFDGMDIRYKRILWAVIAINGAMFVFSHESAVAKLPSCASCKRFGTINENCGNVWFARSEANFVNGTRLFFSLLLTTSEK